MDSVESAFEIINQKKEQLLVHSHELKHTLDEVEATLNVVKTLPDKLEHKVMIPVGPLAFMEGSLIHTNEFMCLLGKDYYVWKSAKGTAEYLERRKGYINDKMSEVDSEMEKVNKYYHQLHYLDSQMREQEFQDEEVQEIIEYIPNEGEPVLIQGPKPLREPERDISRKSEESIPPKQTKTTGQLVGSIVERETPRVGKGNSSEGKYAMYAQKQAAKQESKQMAKPQAKPQQSQEWTNTMRALSAALDESYIEARDEGVIEPSEVLIRGEWKRPLGEEITQEEEEEDEEEDEMTVEDVHTCSYCGKPNVTSKCARCKTVWYCSRGCQVKDWAEHKKTCKALVTTHVSKSVVEPAMPKNDTLKVKEETIVERNVESVKPVVIEREYAKDVKPEQIEQTDKSPRKKSLFRKKMESGLN